MKTETSGWVIPKEPFGPPLNKSEEDPIKYLHNLESLISCRKGSLCGIQFLGHDYESMSPAKIAIDRIKDVHSEYENYRDDLPKNIFFKFEGGLKVGVSGYNRGISIAVMVSDSFGTVLYKDPITEEKWWEEFKKLKELAVPAEKAILIYDHEKRERALIEYNILDNLFFKAGCEVPKKGSWPF